MYAWPRHGTEYDVEDLRLAFRELGFDCEVHEDKTSAEMLNIFVNGTRLHGCEFLAIFVIDVNFAFYILELDNFRHS